MLDIFNDDAFSVVSLTDAINKLKFVPGRIEQLGLFAASGVPTTTVVIEEKDGILTLVAPTPRGGPGSTITKTGRTARPFIVPHFEINDAVMAEEVQNVRAWGSETALEMVQGKVAERLGVHTQSLEATIEYARIGAVKGIVTYADSSTLNLFTEFGVSQEAEIDFDLDNATPASGALRKKCAVATRLIGNNLEATTYTGVHSFCGDAFFDELIAHPEVVDSYLGTPMATVLREGYVLPNGSKIFGAFEFGGIVWENYRGKVGTTDFINTDKCHIFPTGVPNLFRSYFAPADYMETVNTIGQRTYAKQYEMQNGKGVHLDTQTNILSLCTRPKALLLGKRT
ncbi:MAG: major capsid protein [Mesorhizobium sp.]|nr:MAG: major capsid protein [Mesorhizobium sp.]